MNQTERQSAGSSKLDALALLTQDHDKVKKLFEEFEKLKTIEDTEDEKLDIVQEICAELTIHAKIEEEIFYPAVIEAIGQLDIMDEAAVEHKETKEQIEQLVLMAPEEEFYDAKVTVLKEMVEHHIKEEEGKMFPLIQKASIDLAALGQRLSQRKQELQMDMGMIGASMSTGQGREQTQRGPMP
ncbi:hemerythrin domain-containing protein [Methylobacter sp. YRD-M1]|uniref:hemerythrin domain-containing protein n=1 Tax=Methylobacter sp. YRD-M1 TaxID=2911520 RepID=UPI00227C5EF2|nr:hemerythrin domain-containing protein [Methylobacter sp. YRD-M1]WAK03919.1 hemerythrin domain-containing protein [Methylobacter sp. YRD-M1]